MDNSNGNPNRSRPSPPRSKEPTPNSLNSLNQPATHRVQFSKAEYKAPNSLQNSLEGNLSGSHTYDRTPNSVMERTVAADAMSIGGVGGNGAAGYNAAGGMNGHVVGMMGGIDVVEQPRGRPSKSYRDRYQDVRPMSPSPARAGSQSAGRSRSSVGRGVREKGQQGHQGILTGRSRSAGRGVREQRYSYDDDDCASERTPLERWESRKERKMMEKGVTDYISTPRHSSRAPHPQAPPPPPPRAPPVAATRHTAATRTPTPASHKSMSVTKDRANRWSPVEEDGYEEYDDFGATNHHRSSHRGQSRQNERRSEDRSSDRYHDDQHRRSRSHSRDERRYRDVRPDPLGHRQSSLSEAIATLSDARGYASTSGDNPNLNNGGDGSPLYDDVEEEGAGNIHMGEQSPLAIDDHFDHEGSSPQRAPAQRSSHLSSSQRVSPSRSSPQKSSLNRPSPNRSNAGGNQGGGSGDRPGGKSTYADDLLSFTESVTSSVAASNQASNRASNHPNHHGQHNHNGQRYNQLEQGGNNIATVGVQVGASVSGGSSYDHYGEVRVRHRANDFCERFTSLKCNPRQNSKSSLDKTKKRYLWITIAVCAACIIAAGVTIYYLGDMQDKEKEKEKGSSPGLDGRVDETVQPTISLVPSLKPSVSPTEFPTEIPTVRPTSERERLIGEFLHSLSGGDSSKVDAPQYRAKMWLLHEDVLELHLPYSDNQDSSWESEVAYRIKQRFALATCYYSMGVGDGGVVKGWLHDEECREVGDYGTAWDGVGCTDDGRVRALALDGANLHGTIPNELSLLTSIENLIIKNNPGLLGKIPHTLGLHMTQIRQLGLYGNTLTGTVPKNIFRLSNLVYLNLSDNTLMGTINWEELSHHQKNLRRVMLQNNFLEGSIDFHLLAKTSVSLLALSNNLFGGYMDDTVGQLTSLEYLYLDGNKLVGSIPDGIGQLGKLRALNLDDNELYGTLPHTLGELTSLEYLSAKSNVISGGLPASMKLMTGLKTLNLASNALSGHLKHLSDMSSLENVHLYQNSFTGSIDGSILTALPNLEVLFLSSNLLTGGIPSEVASAQKKLRGLYLSDNSLSGKIPEEVCALYKLEDLFLDANALEGTLPSCLGNLSGLKRFHAFKNQLSGFVPGGLMNLPDLIEFGIEENDLRGGMDQETCSREKGLSIWADCNELDGGCECCERCCSDQDKNC